MKTISKFLAAIAVVFSVPSCNAQLKKVKTENVKIFGNCEMCEKTIETAGSLKKVAKVDWNQNSKMATIQYDSTQTTVDEILKRIALAGYDSDKFLAPDNVYKKLPECCQYVRENKTAIAQTELKENQSMQNHDTLMETMSKTNELKIIFENYFELKNALVKSDSKLASSNASALLSTINQVKMEKLSTEEHSAWMKVLNSLKANTSKISTSADIEKQRNIFMELSANFYDLLKAWKHETPVYYQYCPMYNDGNGAHWLSKESAVKNPYYGSQMLTCGKTVETIK